MKIYKINADFENYDSCRIDYDACVLEHDFGENDLLIDFDGTPQSESWWPINMVRYNDVPKLGDYVSKLSSDVMILEKNAVDKLRHTMENVEILLLNCDFGDYYAINILTVLECIDYEKSEFELLSDDLEGGRPRIMYFDKYQFLKEKIDSYPLFKIIDEPKSAIFVSEGFVQEVLKNKITGFKFDLVWEG